MARGLFVFGGSAFFYFTGIELVFVVEYGSVLSFFLFIIWFFLLQFIVDTFFCLSFVMGRTSGLQGSWGYSACTRY